MNSSMIISCGSLFSLFLICDATAKRLQEEYGGELLADLRSELSFADFEEYVRNALPDDVNVKTPIHYLDNQYFL